MPVKSMRPSQTLLTLLFLQNYIQKKIIPLNAVEPHIYKYTLGEYIDTYT